jgi:hypothetical protein
MIAANADSVPLSMSLLHGAQMVFYKTSFYSPTISQLYLPRVTEIDDLLAESTALALEPTHTRPSKHPGNPHPLLPNPVNGIEPKSSKTVAGTICRETLQRFLE